MTSGRMRRLAALTMIGLAFSACADGDRSDKADAPQTRQAASSGGSSDTSMPAAGASDEARGEFGLPDVAAALGVTTPSTAVGTPAVPAGAPSATGGAPAAGGSVLAGGLPNAGTPPAPSGEAVTGSGSGGSASAQPKIAATPEECAMLRQLMAIIDDPQLHQLKADTGC